MNEALRIQIAPSGDHQVLQVPTPGRCGGCDSMRSFFINRDGRTFCVHCDHKKQEAR